MKKIRANLDRYFDRLDEHWKALPVRKQRRYTLYFFSGYLMLTAGVITSVWLDTGKSANDMVIEHIENPVLKKNESPASLQDTLFTNSKDKTDERK